MRAPRDKHGPWPGRHWSRREKEQTLQLWGTIIRASKASKGYTGACKGGHSLQKSFAQGSGLDLELLGHRHFGRAVHMATCYVLPILDARKTFWEQWPASTAPQNDKPQCYLKGCWSYPVHPALAC